MHVWARMWGCRNGTASRLALLKLDKQMRWCKTARSCVYPVVYVAQWNACEEGRCISSRLHVAVCIRLCVLPNGMRVKKADALKHGCNQLCVPGCVCFPNGTRVKKADALKHGCRQL